MTGKDVEPGSLYIVSAPSGAGKTSLVKALIDSTDDIGVAVSHTTRGRRPDEVDGVNYHFVDERGFRQMADDGEFLEWASVFGHLYGTSARAADRVLDAGMHLILEIDWQGAQQIRQRLHAARSIFIFPPSLAALQERLERRAQDDAATVARRMSAALEELSHWEEFDYLVVNDEFDAALRELRQIVAGAGEPFRRESRAPELAALIRDLIPAEQP